MRKVMYGILGLLIVVFGVEGFLIVNNFKRKDNDIKTNYTNKSDVEDKDNDNDFGFDKKEINGELLKLVKPMMRMNEDVRNNGWVFGENYFDDKTNLFMFVWELAINTEGLDAIRDIDANEVEVTGAISFDLEKFRNFYKKITGKDFDIKDLNLDKIIEISRPVVKDGRIYGDYVTGWGGMKLSLKVKNVEAKGNIYVLNLDMLFNDDDSRLIEFESVISSDVLEGYDKFKFADGKLQVEKDENGNYLFLSLVLEKSDDADVTLNDGVKLLETKRNGNDVIQKYEIVLNGKKSIEDLVFTSDVKTNERGEEASYIIMAYFHDAMVFRNSYYNDGFSAYVPFEKSINSLEAFIKERFNENNFRIINGEDKNYLGIYDYYYFMEQEHLQTKLYIYDSKLNLFNKDGFLINLNTSSLILENKVKPWYDDIFKVCDRDCEIRLKIDNHNIYVLHHDYYDYEHESSDLGYLEERLYTINNDKLEYKIINKYKVIDGAGAL